MSEAPDSVSSDGAPFDALCGGFKRPVPRNSSVPLIAQAYAAALYRENFFQRYTLGEVFFETEYRWVGTGNPLLDLALKHIVAEMRNYYARNVENRDMIKQGKPATRLKEGRYIRPDVLGLALDIPRRTLFCELLEISTIDQARETIAGDLVPKLAILRGPVKTLLEEALLRLNQRGTFPQTFDASGAPWIIPPQLIIVPLFPEAGTSTASTRFRWICFGPTYRYRPMPFAGIVNEPPEAPARGLLLYSYHEAGINEVAVPEQVFVNMRKWLANQQRLATRLELLPLNSYTQYWQQNPDDLKRLLGYLAVGVAAVAVVALAVWLAPVIAGSAAALLSEMAVAASAEAMIAQGTAVAAALSHFLPQIMRTAQMAIGAAASLGGLGGLQTAGSY
ncbi:hypothetical protein CYR40_15105 [Chimaeribacter arupi]|uniref:Uncharacterized protein n=1 Tax=Chimaeribacter arupi TaxID=2060066 RepID=A0A2N5EK34_9GAMM|nr:MULTISPECIES: hypothetical protein [Yersiniaceae]PLR30904.1 hypothetical protein CYR23_16785 [Chimaeribacter arupi]PLR44394.1 hypothetical protein CYR40_15105 [Chimaeribacter arupi]PLR46435.1 hypothetical protein CYR34_15775 [Chimaeribacter arupi]WKZ93723.1 hypothetical protein P0E69_07500 [Chimaeribacter arupi]